MRGELVVGEDRNVGLHWVHQDVTWDRNGRLD